MTLLLYGLNESSWCIQIHHVINNSYIYITLFKTKQNMTCSMFPMFVYLKKTTVCLRLFTGQSSPLQYGGDVDTRCVYVCLCSWRLVASNIVTSHPVIFPLETHAFPSPTCGVITAGRIVFLTLKYIFNARSYARPPFICNNDCSSLLWHGNHWHELPADLLQCASCVGMEVQNFYSENIVYKK